MFWNLILKKNVFTKNISIKTLKNKNTTLFALNKVKLLFKKFNQKNNLINNVFIKFLKNNNLKSFINNTKIQYLTILFNSTKNKIKKFENLFFFITLMKKQSYININYKNKEVFFSTNGIVLKKNNILEKSRKKDAKSSIMQIQDCLSFFKKNLKLNENKTNFIISLKKIKPFSRKILKLIFNDLKDYKTNIIISPCVSFSKNNFKKIKSIKRRLRKKYTTIDL